MIIALIAFGSMVSITLVGLIEFIIGAIKGNFIYMAEGMLVMVIMVVLIFAIL